MTRKTRKHIEFMSPLDTNELLSPHIDFCSNKEVFVDGCSGIIEYNSETVRLNCKNIILKLIGTDLTIKAETIEQITISGNILSMEFTGV